MQEINGRWFLYLAHLWHQGWSIVDVTDPTAPEFAPSSPVRKIPDDPIQVADGKMITALSASHPASGVEGQITPKGF
jgi:hypothetical protein